MYDQVCVPTSKPQAGRQQTKLLVYDEIKRTTDSENSWLSLVYLEKHSRSISIYILINNYTAFFVWFISARYTLAQAKITLWFPPSVASFITLLQYWHWIPFLCCQCCIPMVVLFTSSSLLWRKEHLWKFSVLQRVNLSILQISDVRK
jgi:hypothetical protein